MTGRGATTSTSAWSAAQAEAPATSATRPPPPGWVPAAAATGLLLVVVGYVTEQHYSQIEWRLSAPIPVFWWIAGDVAAMLGVPLFFVAAGAALGRLAERPPRHVLLSQVLPYLGWYAFATVAATAVLLRFDPEFGLAPIHDRTDFLLHAVLPPAGLSLTYALALGALLALLSHRLPAPLVLGAAGAAAVLVAWSIRWAPDLAGGADLARQLLFVLLGARLPRILRTLAGTASWLRFAAAAIGFAAVTGVLLLAGDAAAWIRPFAVGLAALPCGLSLAALLGDLPGTGRLFTTVARAAAPIAALLLPAAAFADTVLLRRLSTVNTAVQGVAAVVEPVLIVLAIVGGGLILRATTVRLRGRQRPAR